MSEGRRENQALLKGSTYKNCLQAESLMKDLTDLTNPILYYPKTERQQQALRKYHKHCFYLDKDTKDLFYLNSRGTPIAVPSIKLLSTHLHQVKPGSEGYKLQYQNNIKKPDTIIVRKIESEQFGIGFKMNNEMMQRLLPDDFAIDPLIRLADETLRKMRLYETRCLKSPTLFAESKEFSQENIFGMIQIKEMLEGHATNELQYFTRPPTKLDFLGKGRNSYAFYVDPKNPNHYEFWHVERSYDVPLLTKMSLKKQEVSYLRYMCLGATHGSKPQQDLYLSLHSQRYREYCEWYEMGQALKNQAEGDSHRTIISLSDTLSMRIPNLILSHFSPCKHLMDEWAYYEAYNDFTRVLNITQRTAANALFLERCQKIQHHLEVIGKDYYQAYVDSKGLVPQEKRQKILKMLAELIKDGHSPQASHYLRTRHRVYLEALQEDNLDHYEPSSFIWDRNKTLYYIDEHKNLVLIPLTSTILQKFSSMEDHPKNAKLYISAREVYYAISRPSFAYFIWENLTYYPSWWRSDRHEYFHTGTAQEMLYEIHDKKLSWRAAIYQVFKIILFVAIPAILASVGLWIPMGLLALKGASLLIFNWTMLAWNIEFTVRCLRSIGYTILHPELKQLDNMLQTLDEDLHHIKYLEENIEDTDFEESSFLFR